MYKYTAEVTGMRCGMCEAHTNDAIRANFKVDSVKSDRSKNETVIIAEELDEDKVKETITGLGYEVGNITKEEYKKKKFFGLF